MTFHAKYDISCELGNNLLEMSNSIFWKKNAINFSSADFAHNVLSVKDIFKGNIPHNLRDLGLSIVTNFLAISVMTS